VRLAALIVGGVELRIGDFVTVATTIGVLETLIDFFFSFSDDIFFSRFDFGLLRNLRLLGDCEENDDCDCGSFL
jgi:hypothetical protein